MAHVRAFPIVVTVAALVTGACASGPSPRATDPAQRMDAAYAALARDDFQAATQELYAVVSRCEQDAETRRALLVLASAELDASNPGGSPHVAARLTDLYLGFPDVDPEQRVVARTLHRLATRLETLVPPGEEAAAGDTALSRLDICAFQGQTGKDGPGDPQAAAPWVQAVSDRSTSLRHRVHELEAELERITQLLTNGTVPADGGAR